MRHLSVSLLVLPLLLPVVACSALFDDVEMNEETIENVGEEEHAVTLHVAGPGGLSVWAGDTTELVDCRATSNDDVVCEFFVLTGEAITIEVEPDEDTGFEYYDGACDSDRDPCELTVDENLVVFGRFGPKDMDSPGSDLCWFASGPARCTTPRLAVRPTI